MKTQHEFVDNLVMIFEQEMDPTCMKRNEEERVGETKIIKLTGSKLIHVSLHKIVYM